MANEDMVLVEGAAPLIPPLEMAVEGLEPLDPHEVARFEGEGGPAPLEVD